MIECIKFTTHVKGSLQGYAELRVPFWGLDIPGFALHRKDGKRWIKLPSKEYKDREGNIQYNSTMRFIEKPHFRVFYRQAVDAIDRFCSENQIL